MGNLIFIGGIHGVGKTSLCKQISTKFGVPHFSASQLISDAKRELYSKSKLIENIDANQDFLRLSVPQHQESRHRQRERFNRQFERGGRPSA